jgi:hypothetical protein
LDRKVMKNGILAVIDALDERIRKHHESFYVTAKGNRSAGTFARDNWQHFRSFALLQGSVGLVIRRFEPAEKGALPLKSICGVYADNRGRVVLSTAAEIRRAMHTDNATGKPLPQLADHVRYVDARVILPGLRGEIIGEL